MSDDRTLAPFSRIVLASNNAGKLREFTALFSTVGIEIVPQGELAVPEAEEPFGTFIENALTKARHASRLTGLPAIADDSGLCVRALRGAPGVYSARYAQRAGRAPGDAANNAYLVEQLRGVDDRRAYYCCVLALVRHADDPEPLFAEGRWTGEIVDTPRGEHGFGYDPYFYLPSLGATAAELEPAVKNTHSHRALALKALLARLAEEPA
ncbi:non-canonical purine NTP pyrophosphatase, RdgB/HAM1 family [Burkholderia ambifaria AMMD]|uniref:dITP/XTP pyrophosphatase n=1 Tax=Burkholderia ambifaria (strain ATCC BAA-244 / DSM 16087 / CCUG 44356 / LMG 19182 / AMMD) TaxID=339670 RepID=Q0BHF8_BURCM|nr:RdgB/HAM1 family non-canonical purine NTP pyrophosphatase [Burkholderia ambifaria]ABI86415.1 non-canonical purine NTP pyrophosphatase, rdgB/HAM1 family [Burkholderia ambifaria AMMD]AJY23150.1 non-canonical purine NTP pyrophosphatase, RdgB/HAM1 family [Burkholderia ambifaria AMMD]MBR7929967.1 RdgB/HAM1 family non-canonical purine NTP pyrophosphatase [Burkholderia ambifaria]PEH66292.1 non-canonical purine NTP pyrophosphatase [Burkholderia ambifaria]QQC03254.1 RdgB/HAM1 family non-canonical pu